MADIQEAITIGELSRQMQKFEERLFGNGQPGILKEMDERIDEGESWRDRLIGAWVLALALGGFVEYWLHSKK